MPKTEHTKREGDAVYIHPKAAWEKLRMAGKTRQNVYIYGATGYGKTELLRRYLRRRKHTWLNAGELTAQQLQELELPRGVIVVIDDLALVHAPDVQAEILRLVETPNVWLLMAGRCPLPHWLSPMYMNCRLTIIPEEDLALTKETLSELYLAWGIQMPQKILEEILYPLTEGNPVGARILAMEMSHGARYTPELLEKLVDNFWAYLDRTVYNKWDGSIRDLAVQMAVMGSFTIPQAEELTGAENVVQVLQQARETGNLFRIRGGVYTMRPSFQNSMIWRLKHTYSREQRNALYDRAGHIYTRAGDIPRALAMFEASGNRQKIRDLLVRNVQQANGGYYYELSRYYLALPEEEVLASPDLMAALSMVCSVRLDAAGSERWYQALVRYAEQVEGDAKKRAMENQIYLDIKLPHRGSSKMVEILQRSAKTAEQEHLNLGNMRVTDGIPSLLNGGKDFCLWVKDGREVIKQITRPLEILLGSKSRGMLELAQAESMFEQAEDDTKALELANRGMMETMASGKFELQFVGAAVVARLYLVGGHIDDAYRTLEEIELRARQLSAHRIERNVHAMQCRVMLWQGRLEEAERWMDQEPADDLTFNSLDRYCYLTRVRVYMAKERYDRATTLLTRLAQYADHTDRLWIQMECSLLWAIVRYRTGDEAWQPQLLAVLQRAEAYHFVRLFSREGSALLDLLRELQDTGKAGGAFFAEVLAKTSRLAEAYPGYLRRSAGAEQARLTDRCLQVLRMQSMGLSRGEIAQQLNLSERSVKYQSEQAYRKLGVNNKIEAIETARRMHLL